MKLRDLGLTFAPPQDDALHYPTVRQRTYPDTVMDNMDKITHFTRTADDVSC